MRDLDLKGFNSKVVQSIKEGREKAKDALLYQNRKAQTRKYSDIIGLKAKQVVSKAQSIASNIEDKFEGR